MYLDSYTSAANTAIGAAFGIIIGILVVVVAFLIVMLIGKAKMYKKAGQPGWAVIIPFYSEYVYTKVADVNWWWMFLLCASTIAGYLVGSSSDSDYAQGIEGLCSLVALFGYFVCNYNIAKKLHKETGFAVLTTIFSGILWMVIGFSKSMQFDQTVPVSPNGILDKDKAVAPANAEASQAQQASPVVQSTPQEAAPSTPVQEAEPASAVQSAPATNVCPSCGAQLKEGAKFCESCGKEIQ